MVASKHEGFEHDFENDPIDARVEGEVGARTSGSHHMEQWDAVWLLL
jgi:hypothetical protein